MGRIAFAPLMLALLSGCGNWAASPAQARRTPTESLTEARSGFDTNLVQKTSAGQQLPEPPPDLFQTVQFESELGKLGAYLTPDPMDGKKHPAIIWITGGDCSTIDEGVWQDSPPSNDQTARQYREAGIVMMYPTLRGGNKNPGVHEGFFGEIDDVISAAEFLSKQDYVDPERIYLGGHSSGGTMVLLAAECSAKFRAVFSFGPVNDLRKVPESFKTLFMPFDTSDSRELVLRTPGLWLHSIKQPVFVFAGTVRDGALGEIKEMDRSTSNPSVHFYIVKGADHFNILAPLNRLVAKKILQDNGAECNITFTPDELNRPFASP